MRIPRLRCVAITYRARSRSGLREHHRLAEHGISLQNTSAGSALDRARTLRTPAEVGRMRIPWLRCVAIALSPSNASLELAIASEPLQKASAGRALDHVSTLGTQAGAGRMRIPPRRTPSFEPVFGAVGGMRARCKVRWRPSYEGLALPNLNAII